MKVDFDYILQDLFGAPIMDGNSGEQKPATLRSVVANALLITIPEDATMNGAKKIELYNIALRVHNSEEPVDITAAEATLIQDRLARIYGPLVVGQCHDLLDGAEK